MLYTLDERAPVSYLTRGYDPAGGDWYDQCVYDVAGPKDVPTLRARLLAGWQPGAPYHLTAVNALMRTPDGRTTPYSPAFDSTALARASLWWVTAEMTELVERAALSLPPTTLTDELVAEPWGLVAFERPLVGSDAQTGEPILVHAILWGITTFTGDDGPRVGPLDRPREVWRPNEQCCLTIACYGRLAIDEHGRHLGTTRGGANLGPWVPEGRTDWVWGQDTASPSVEGFDEIHRTSMEEERRWLASLWLLAAQRRLTDETTVRRPRAERRRHERELPGRPELTNPAVRCVDVRRPEPPAHEAEHGRAVNWSRRWIVEGHWRQQAYGPGWSLRRPLFIGEFVKGPADRPLVLKETVNVLRTSPGERSE